MAASRSSSSGSITRAADEPGAGAVEPLGAEADGGALLLRGTAYSGLSFSGFKVWYDEASASLVLLRRGVFHRIRLGTGSQVSHAAMRRRATRDSAREAEEGAEQVDLSSEHHEERDPGAEPTPVVGTPTPPSRTKSPDAVGAYDQTIDNVSSGPVLDVKFSASGDYLAVQRSESTVHVVDLVSGREILLGCRSVSGNCILRGGIVWLDEPGYDGHDGTNYNRAAAPLNGQSAGGNAFSALIKRQTTTSPEPPALALATRFGLEVYRLPSREREERGCRLLSTIKHESSSMWHLPDSDLVCLATRNDQRSIVPLKLRGAAPPQRLPVIQLATPATQRDIVLVTLYREPYLLHLDKAASSMHVYRVRAQGSDLTHTYSLGAPGSYGISAVDNVLCVHNLDTRQSLLHDVKDSVSEALCPPVPIVRPRSTAGSKMHALKASHHQDSAPASRAVVVTVRDSDSTTIELARSASRIADSGDFAACDAATGRLLVALNNDSLAGCGFETVLRKFQDTKRPLALVFRDASGYKGDAASVPASVPPQRAKLPRPPTGAGTGYPKAWVFLPRHWVLDTSAGRLWALQLDLDALLASRHRVYVTGDDDAAQSAREQKRVAAFLLRRRCVPPRIKGFAQCASRPESYGKAVLLGRLARGLEDRIPLTELAAIFSAMNDPYVEAFKEAQRGKPLASTPATQVSPSSASSLASKSSSSGGQATASVPPGEAVPLTAAEQLRALSPSPPPPPAASPNLPVLSGPDVVSDTPALPRFMSLFVAGSEADGEHGPPLGDFRSPSGEAVVLQLDFFRHALCRAFRAANAGSAVLNMPSRDTQWFAAGASAYLQSLHSHGIPPEVHISEFVAWALAQSHQEQQLYQLVQYHVLVDSAELARMLLEAVRCAVVVLLRPFFCVHHHPLRLVARVRVRRP